MAHIPTARATEEEMSPIRLPARVQELFDRYPYIAHPEAEEVLNELEFIFEHHADWGEALGDRMAGATNTGKTTVMVEFIRRHPPVKTPEGWRHPVLYARLSEKSTLKSVYAKILEALGDPQYGQGTESHLRERATNLLKSAHVKLVFIDEPHHLTETGSDKARVSTSHLAKVMVDKGICVIFGGVHSVDDLVVSADEMARRFRGRLTLQPYRVSVPEHVSILRAFADTVGARLRHVAPVRLGSENRWFSRLLAISAGVPGTMCQLTRQAETRARLAGDRVLTLQHFSAAWKRFAASRELGLRHLERAGTKTLVDVFKLDDEEVAAIVGRLVGA